MDSIHVQIAVHKLTRCARPDLYLQLIEPSENTLAFPLIPTGSHAPRLSLQRLSAVPQTLDLQMEFNLHV